MLKLKKKLLIYTIKNIFNQQLVVLLFHYNTMNVKNFSKLKKELIKFKDIKIFIVKNKLVSNFAIENSVLNQNVNNFFEKKNNATSLKQISENKETIISNKKQKSQKTKVLLPLLFQGPTLIISCKSIQDENGVLLPSFIFNTLEKYKNIVFLGGKIDNQYINHLDVKKLNTINSANTSKKQINLNLLQQLNSKFLVLLTYKKFLYKNISILITPQIILLKLLKSLIAIKSKN